MSVRVNVDIRALCVPDAHHERRHDRRDTEDQTVQSAWQALLMRAEAVATQGRSTETPWDGAIGARHRRAASRAREAVAWDVHFVRREEHGRQHRGMRCSSMDAGRGSTPRKAIATRTPRARREAAAEAWRAACSCVRAGTLRKKVVEASVAMPEASSVARGGYRAETIATLGWKTEDIGFSSRMCGHSVLTFGMTILPMTTYYF